MVICELLACQQKQMQLTVIAQHGVKIIINWDVSTWGRDNRTHNKSSNFYVTDGFYQTIKVSRQNRPILSFVCDRQ